MKKVISIVFTLIGALLYLNTAYSSQPTTFLGPTIRTGYTNTLTNTTAYSVAGEVGAKNYRVDGTLGWKIRNDQRLKITGEYLWQKITYNFFAGNTQQWVNQGAVGAAYEYDLPGYALKPQLDLSGYYSHAPSKNLNTVSGTLVNSGGVLQNFVDARRIAGSNAGGVAPGITIHPWQGAKVGADLNYDNVSYNKNGAPSQNAKGFGGTARFDQALTKDVDLGLVAGNRQQFNNYQANLNWTKDSSAGEWVWGVGAAYTAGKNTLPSTYNVVATVKFLVDQKTPAAQPIHRDANFKDVYKDEVPPVQPVFDDFKKWTSDPAIYMPQVLAITDEKLQTTTPTPSCALLAPALLSAIAGPPLFHVDGTFPTAANFSGDNLTFTITQVTPFAPFPTPTTTVTINPTTGVVSVHDGLPPAQTNGTFTVTATNCLGSVTSNVFTISVT